MPDDSAVTTENSESKDPHPSARRRSPRPTPVIERNVRALVDHAAELERTRSAGDRLALAVSRFAGSMRFVYLHVAFFIIWALGDLGWIPGLPEYDTSFTVLGTMTSIEAIFLATFVLIAQNRLSEQEEARSNLDVQVTLLTEHEVTHILRIVAAMSEKMGLDASQNPEILDLLRDIAPKDVLHRIEKHGSVP